MNYGSQSTTYNTGVYYKPQAKTACEMENISLPNGWREINKYVMCTMKIYTANMCSHLQRIFWNLA